MEDEGEAPLKVPDVEDEEKEVLPESPEAPGAGDLREADEYGPE